MKLDYEPINKYEALHNIEKLREMQTESQISLGLYLAHLAIRNIKTVERHGRWLHPICKVMSTCSVCGYEFFDYLEADKYCGNCGAIMDLEEE